jgi:pimeloyl-ACP methyl ester carboxylesterase
MAERMEDKLRKRFGSRDYNALDPEMRKTFVKVINQDLTDLYKDIQASTLLIWGDSDSETPLWMAKEMEKRIPDAGLVILEGGSHFAYLEQIQRFNTIVSHFLKGDE